METCCCSNHHYKSILVCHGLTRITPRRVLLLLHLPKAGTINRCCLSDPGVQGFLGYILGTRNQRFAPIGIGCQSLHHGYQDYYPIRRWLAVKIIRLQHFLQGRRRVVAKYPNGKPQDSGVGKGRFLLDDLEIGRIGFDGTVLVHAGDASQVR